MANLTPLSRPTHNVVAIDPHPRDSLSDGFNYPTFHLLNKQARVFLSQTQRVSPIYHYRLLAVANIKGWFAAVKTESRGTSIILSTLHELRSSLRAAKETDENLFVPRRTLRLPAEDVNIIVFGMQDTRLLVGFTGGQLLVYDTAHLFSNGTGDVVPLSMSKASSAPFLQILPNPGAEADLAQLAAVLRGDGVVQVLDMNKLDAQCGWIGEGDAAPVAISWAPKGKHLAIGLRAGDIITYALSSNTVPHKQIPPTVDGYLVSLDWIASPLVFKSTYCSKIPESSDATLHIVHADAKTSAGFYYNLMHPFPAADRNKMHALTLHIPKWDEDPGASPENASGLVVFGDMSSVDLEVLAHKGTQWFQQSQENPLQLPLDKNMNDTILTSLEADLTDLEATVPVMYAYLNDGTLQGWKLDHPKPYVGMVKPESTTVFNGPIIAQETPAFAAAFSPPATSPPPFGQAGGSSTVSQPTSPFAQPRLPAPTFTQQSTFGQPSFSSGQSSSAFGQNNGSALGSAPKPASGFGSLAPVASTTSTFGGFGTSNVFGQSSFGFGGAPATTQSSTTQPITREASMSDETSLNNLSLGGDQTGSQSKGGGVFGSFTPLANAPAPTSAFSSIVKPATGFGAFSNYQSQQTLTPTSNEPPKSGFGAGAPATPATPPGQPTFGQSGFAKPTFGQSSFGQSSFGRPSFPPAAGAGGFGSFASGGPSGFATPLKLATVPATGGFGAFATPGATTTTPSSEPPKASPFVASPGAFGSTQAPFKPSAPQDSPPSSPEPMAVVKSALPADDDDMSPPGSPVKRETALATTTPAQPPPAHAFSNLSAPVRPASGFGAFGTVSANSPFFKKTETMPTTPTALFGKQTISTTPANPPPNTTAPTFGAPSMPSTKSAFPPITSSTTPAKSPPSGGFSAFSGTSTGFASFAGSGKSFSELLKTKDDGTVFEKAKEPVASETPKKEEPPVVVGAPRTPVFTPPPMPVSTTPASEPSQKLEGKEAEIKKESAPVKKPISSDESFVEVTKEEGEITDEETDRKGPKEEAEYDGYLSGSLGPSDSEGSIDGTEESENESEGAVAKEGPGKLSASVDPATVPLPVSRSPSAAPEVPSIQITPSDPTVMPPPGREPSTTPPGTPERPPTSLSAKPTPSTTPAVQPFNLGLGRPSTRPARSSPLAGLPVTSSDQEGVEGTKEKGKVDLPKTRTTPSPKAPAAKLPVKNEQEKEATPLKPKTSPLLSSPTPAVVKSTPLVLGAVEKVPTGPSELPFSFKKTEPTKPSSIFGGGTAQGSYFGRSAASEPPTPSAGAPAKLPFAFKTDAGTISPTSPFGATPPRPMSFPTTVALSGANSLDLNRPASVPPSFTTPALPVTFNIKATSYEASSAFGKPFVAASLTPTASQAPIEEGLQKECATLYNAMNQELEELRQLAQEAIKKRQDLTKSRGVSLHKADLGDNSEWDLVDVAQFGQLLKQIGPDLLALRELRGELKQQIRQIESKMLKAGTRKEEIARFTKAQNDKEFAKMLKTRTLGPEHLETQTQLRRNIRTIRDRVGKLETRLQDSKKRLAEANSGKPGFRAPTLDTVNRTYRNIDFAIQYQTQEIAHLSERVAKLKVTTPRKALPSQSDPRLSDSELRRPFNVTPHIAVTTAAALNAEMSAQKLKRALLAARKEPLLNDKAAQSLPARVAFKTPQKIAIRPTDSPSHFAFKSSISGPLFQAGETPQTPILDWSFPEDNFNPSPSPPTRRGTGRTKMHATNTPLKKSVVSSQAPPATFDWGPLPKFDQQPTLIGSVTPVKLTPTNPPGFVPLTSFKK